MSDRIALQTRAMLLRQVVQDIAEEKIGIPAFQRSFVWKAEQVRDLFDSIRNGFPIGSIVLWESEKALPVIDFLTDTPYHKHKTISYVLDGRQRLTAFYGCISRETEKDRRLRLAYNLRNDRFEYPDSNKKPDDLTVLISDIFDTFTLIGILQQLSAQYAYEPSLQLWLNRAKTLNSILQEYQCVVISLSDCTLGQANKVFSRINSKGTDIRKAEMMQAVAYSEGSPLLSTSIKNIQKELKRYRFEHLSDNDILNCYFRFAGKNFYDISIKGDPQEIEKLSLTEYSEQVRQAVLRTARFLREKCYVYDSKWLPYKHQFTALCAFFAKYPEPTPRQAQELKRWFFYTTACQTFGNSSLQILRAVFSKFNDFVDGKRTTPIDYKPVTLEKDFRFKLRANSVKASFLILALTHNYLQCSHNVCISDFQVKHYGGTSPTDYFVVFGKDDENQLTRLLNKDSGPSLWLPQNDLDKDIHKFALDQDALHHYKSNKSAYRLLRENIFHNCQQHLWQTLFPTL